MAVQGCQLKVANEEKEKRGFYAQARKAQRASKRSRDDAEKW